MPDWALLLIDLQHAFAIRTMQCRARSNSAAEAAVTQLVSLAGNCGLPMTNIHRNDRNDRDPASSFRSGHPGGQPMPFAAQQPAEAVLTKFGSSGFAGTGLAEYLT
jgi:nicotinamidase-related amidase